MLSTTASVKSFDFSSIGPGPGGDEVSADESRLFLLRFSAVSQSGHGVDELSLSQVDDSDMAMLNKKSLASAALFIGFF